MKKPWIPLLSLFGVLILAGAVAALAVPARAPEPPEPAEPPEPPEPPEAPDAETFHVRFAGGTWLGVHIDEVTEEKAGALRLRGAFGALVTEVEKESPAEKAGIRADDVIVSFQGERVEGTAALRRMVRETPPGRTVRIEVNRGGETVSLEAAIEARKESFLGRGGRAFHLPDLSGIEIPPIDLSHLHGDGDTRIIIRRGPRLGVEIEDLTPQLADYFGVRSGEGILIKEVREGTPAEKAGLKAGDVIVKVEGRAVADAGDLREALDEQEESVEVTIVRDRSERTIQVKLEPSGKSEWRSPLSDEDRDEIRRAVDEARRAHREAMREQQEARREREEAFREQRDAIRLLRHAEGELIHRQIQRPAPGAPRLVEI